MERLLHERCVRNQLDERVMPRLLDQHPETGFERWEYGGIFQRNPQVTLGITMGIT
jgi:hypothetical protein